MRPDGIPFLTRVRYSLARYAEHFLRVKVSEEALQQKLVRQLEARGTGRKLEIPRVEGISPEEFRRNYVHKGLPVILTKFGAHWPARSKWTLEYLEQRYGEHPVATMANESKDNDGVFDMEEVPFKLIIEAMRTGDTRRYLRFNDLLYQFPELVDDIDRANFFRMKNPLKLGHNFQVFMGAKGTGTKLHAAPFNNLFVQVMGTKRWFMTSQRHDPILRPPVNRGPYFLSRYNPRSPDFTEFPACRYMDYYDFELHEGDALYLPPSIWHFVENLTPTMAVSFRWLSVQSFTNNFSHMLLMICATNPNIFFLMKHKKRYAEVFKHLQKSKQKELQAAQKYL